MDSGPAGQNQKNSGQNRDHYQGQLENWELKHKAFHRWCISPALHLDTPLRQFCSRISNTLLVVSAFQPVGEYTETQDMHVHVHNGFLCDSLLQSTETQDMHVHVHIGFICDTLLQTSDFSLSGLLIDRTIAVLFA